MFTLPLRACAFGLTTTILANAGNAAVIEYGATGFITSSDYPNEVAVGDQFSMSFSYDDSIRDTDGRTTYGNFPSALRSLSFQLIPGLVTGSYTGGFTVAGRVFIQPDDFRLAVSGGMFGPLGGHGLNLFDVFLDDFSPTNPISDPGGAPTLDEVIHRRLFLDDFGRTTVAFDTNYNKTGFDGQITSLTIVPEPSALGLLALGLVAAIRRSGRREAPRRALCRLANNL